MPPRAPTFLLLLASCIAAGCASHPRPRTPVPLRPEAVGAVEFYGPGLVATDDSGESVTFTLEAPAAVMILRVWPLWRLEPLYPTRNRDTTRFQAGTHVVRVARPVPWDTVAGAWGEPPPPPPGSRAAREQEASRCIFDQLRRRGQPTQARPAADTAAAAADVDAIEAGCRRAAGLSAPVERNAKATPIREYYIVLVASDVSLDAKHLRQKLTGIDISGTEIVSVLQALPGFVAGARARTWAGYTARVGP